MQKHMILFSQKLLFLFGYLLFTFWELQLRNEGLLLSSITHTDTQRILYLFLSSYICFVRNHPASCFDPWRSAVNFPVVVSAEENLHNGSSAHLKPRELSSVCCPWGQNSLNIKNTQIHKPFRYLFTRFKRSRVGTLRSSVATSLSYHPGVNRVPLKPQRAQWVASELATCLHAHPKSFHPKDNNEPSLNETHGSSET